LSGAWVRRQRHRTCKLLNHVRRDLVAGYLANPRFEVGHVAGMLGFMQHASFTRWFAREFGATPTDWRQRGEDVASRNTKRASRVSRAS
jgi:AraC-like DNA-binding protein